VRQTLDTLSARVRKFLSRQVAPCVHTKHKRLRSAPTMLTKKSTRKTRKATATATAAANGAKSKSAPPAAPPLQLSDQENKAPTANGAKSADKTDAITTDAELLEALVFACETTTVLWKAARAGNTPVVVALLGVGADCEAGVEVAVRQPHSSPGSSVYVTPLFAAAAGGNTDTVAALLQHGAVAGGAAGTEALHAAQNDETKALLRAHGAGLIDECAVGDAAAVRQLLALGADANAAVGQGFVAFEADGGATRLRAPPLDGKEEFDEINAVKRTPLYVAVAGGHAEVVSMLLVAGADASADIEVEVEVDVEEVKDTGSTTTTTTTKIVKRSLMFAAVAGGHSDVVSVLLAAGADANAEAGEVKLTVTPGDSRQYCKISHQYCRKSNRSPKTATKVVQRTMLYFAAAGGHAEVVSTLLGGGADAAADIVDETAGNDGTMSMTVKRTLTSVAAAGGHTDVVDVLLAASDAKGKGKGGGEGQGQGQGNAATLMSACHGGHLDVVVQLLAAGVDANTKCDGEGRPAVGDEVRVVGGQGAGSFATVTGTAGGPHIMDYRRPWSFKLEGVGCGSEDYMAEQIVLQVAPLHAAMKVSRYDCDRQMDAYNKDRGYQQGQGWDHFEDVGDYKVDAGGFADVALALLGAGATAEGKAGAAALVSACSLESAELVEQLLAAGADANAKACVKMQFTHDRTTYEPCSALYVASSSEVVAQLLAAGADVDAGGVVRMYNLSAPVHNRTWTYVQTPLNKAIGDQNAEKVHQLLGAGAPLPLPRGGRQAKFPVPLIKAVLKLRGLKTGGAKPELLARLQNA
jgi:ankyrin repeat protein